VNTATAQMWEDERRRNEATGYYAMQSTMPRFPAALL
jgi:hypothetical protein